MIIIIIKVVNQQQVSTMTVSKPTVWQLFQCSIYRYEPFIYFILDLNLEYVYTPKQIIVLDIIIKVHLNILTKMTLSEIKWTANTMLVFLAIYIEIYLKTTYLDTAFAWFLL
jgi:hypothetical protein